MTKPAFDLVCMSYPTRARLPQKALYTELGYPDRAVSLYWQNTCAVRVSMALVKAGLQIPGQTIVKAGKLRGRRIEHNVVKLAHYLARKELLGPPEQFASASEARSSIQGEGRKGIVAYFKLNGPTDSQNHIDVVGPGAGGYAECGSGCYWGSVSAWFWPLH